MPLALLLVDVQNGFIEEHLSPEEARKLTDNIDVLLTKCRQHSIPVFYIITQTQADGSDAMPHWQPDKVNTFTEGSYLSQIPDSIKPEEDDLVINKQFFSSFQHPELHQKLQERGIHELIISGVHTHACIRETITSAYQLGYKTYVSKDTVASYDKEHAEKTIGFLAERSTSILNNDNDLDDLIKHNSQSLESFEHYNPCNHSELLYRLTPQLKQQQSTIITINNNKPAWHSKSANERKERLEQFLTVLKKNTDSLVELLIYEVAKPAADAQSELQFGFDLCEHTLNSYTDKETIESKVTLHYEPVGMVALITPWNNPFAIPMSKLFAALINGNTVIWKPSPHTHKISSFLYELIKHCGLSDYVGLLEGNQSTGQYLINQPSINAVSFTGSTQTGLRLAEQCAQTNKRFQGELGGSNPALIFPDINITSELTNTLALSAFSYSGQRCTAIRRIIIHESLIDTFIDLFTHSVEALAIGKPNDHGTQIGPLINKSAKSQLLSTIQHAQMLGAKIITGGDYNEQDFINGNYLKPFVILDNNTESPLIQQEQFGPIVCISTFNTYEQAIEMANSTSMGLLAAIYTNDKATKRKAAQDIEAGQIVVNSARPHFHPEAPFSGKKLSVIGLPEHGRWDRDFYSTPKVIYSD